MGRHLLEMGVQPVPDMGRLLDECYEAQLDGEFTAADQFATQLVSSVSDTMNAVNAELQDVLTVGLLLSRPRQGTRKLSMNFVFTDRHDPKHKMECGVTTVLENQEMVLVAECLGRTGEMVRVGLFDPEASSVLRTAVETFLFDSAEHFANGAA